MDDKKTPSSALNRNNLEGTILEPDGPDAHQEGFLMDGQTHMEAITA